MIFADKISYFGHILFTRSNNKVAKILTKNKMH